jgi:hypothetical protein
MRRSSNLLSLLAIAAGIGAVPGASAATYTLRNMPRIQGLDCFGFGGSRMHRGGFGGVPRYNQRKARKLARQTGNHPANRSRA